MSRRIATFLTLGLSVAACSGSEAPSCEEALATLAACENPADARCADDSVAARTVAAASCADARGKADDWFGNVGWGQACSWNWQCQGDTRHSCNHGTCYLRADEGNGCDQADDEDCEEGLHCADNPADSPVEGLCQRSADAKAPALYAETPLASEASDFEAIARDVMGIQMKIALAGLNGDQELRRTFHVKKHACLVGDFEVLAAPTALAQGPVFSRPQHFPALVRFSNAGAVAGPDAAETSQGLAIKLIGVDGEKILDGQKDAVTQDFLLVNMAASPIARANEFVEAVKAKMGGAEPFMKYLMIHPRIGARFAKLAQNKAASVRTQTFWSANANRHGDLAVKYIAKPCAGTPGPLVSEGSDHLRADLALALASGEVCFDFYAQPQTDPLAMSIEDASAEWSETASPPQRLARLTIAATELGTATSDAAEAACNQHSFNAWNSAVEHRPLGNINRARRHAYEASRNMRGAAPEPTAVPQ